MIPKIPLITTELASLDNLKAMVKQHEQDKTQSLVDLNKNLVEALKHARIMIYELGGYTDVQANSPCKASTDLIDSLISKCEGGNV